MRFFPFLVAVAACSRDAPVDYRPVAREFAQALAARDYARAHAMLSGERRQGTTVEDLRAAFEAIVPPDFGPIGPIEVGETMADWPGRKPGDLGWAYVSIGGAVYSEAVIVVITAEDGNARIREVEFGRP